MSYKLLNEEKTYLNFLKKRYTREAKDDVKDIEVENPGILEVPEGKNVEDLGEDHFKSLIKKKGWEKISRALVNLIRWNKKKDPKLSSWADNMQAKLSKWVDNEREKAGDENLYEIGPYVAPPKERGGFGSIKGSSSSGGFGSIKGRPTEQSDADKEMGPSDEEEDEINNESFNLCIEDYLFDSDDELISEAPIKYSASKIIKAGDDIARAVERKEKAGCEKWTVKAPFKSKEYKRKMMACKAAAAIKGLQAAIKLEKGMLKHCKNEKCIQAVKNDIADAIEEINHNKKYYL